MLARIPWPLFRMFLLGGVGIMAVIWSLVRFYTVPRPPMIVPAATPSASNEIAAPDLIEWLPEEGDASRSP